MLKTVLRRLFKPKPLKQERPPDICETCMQVGYRIGVQQTMLRMGNLVYTKQFSEMKVKGER